MQIPIFFTLKEMLATSQNLPNFPEKWEILSNLVDTAGRLDMVRVAYKKPIKVTSGYRSAAVNTAVHGSKTSAHRKGLAADIVPLRNTKANMQALAALCRENIVNFDIDQLIIYTKDGKDSADIAWIHVGLASRPRHQLLFKKY